MLFNSYSFIFLYLPITFAGMFVLAKHSHRLAALWLALASLTFYAVWDARFVMLLLGSIGFNYGAGYLIGLRREAGHAKLLLAGAIGINLPFMAEPFKPSPPLVPASTVLLMVIILLVMPQGLFGRKE